MGRSCTSYSPYSDRYKSDNIDVNVTARPAAGILGVMALPISGAWKSIRKAVGGAPTKALAKSRIGMSQDLAQGVGREERESILKRFGELEKEIPERKERLKKTAKLFMTGDEKAFEEELGVKPDPKTGDKEGTEGKVETSSTEEMKGQIRQSVESQIAAVPEKGDELEEAEKRGYERAMMEFKKQQELEAGKK